MKPAENMDFLKEPRADGNTPCQAPEKSILEGMPVCKPARCPASPRRAVRRASRSLAMTDQPDLFAQPLAAIDDAAAPSTDPIGAEAPCPIDTPPSDAGAVPASTFVVDRVAASSRIQPECATPRATRKHGSVRLHLSDAAEPKAGIELRAPSTESLPATVRACIDALDRSGKLPAADRERFEYAVRHVSRVAKVEAEELPADPVALRPLLARTLPAATRSPARPLSQARAALRDLLARAGWIDEASLRTAPTQGTWGRLLAEASALASIKGLPALARFCAGRSISPDAVGASTFIDYESHLCCRTLEPHPRETMLATAKRWSALARAIPFWPQGEIVLPLLKVGRRQSAGVLGHNADTVGLSAHHTLSIGSVTVSLAPSGMPAPPARAEAIVPALVGAARPANVAACLAWAQANSSLPEAAIRRAESAVTLIARVLRRSSAEIPAAPRELRPLLGSVLPAAHQVSQKRWSNARADLKSLLIATGWVSPLARRTAPVTGRWATLIAGASTSAPVRMLPPFARWCAAEAIAPEDVCPQHVENFESFLAEATLSENPRSTVSQLTRAWNRLAREAPGWPQTRLALTSRRISKRASIADLAATFVTDLAAYLQSLANPDPFDPDASRPLASRSCAQARAAILRAVAVLIASGIPSDTFQRLADLAAPERVKQVLTVLHREAGAKWTSQTLHFANALIVMARRWAKVTPETLEALISLRRAIRLPRNGLSQRAQETLARLSDERVRRELFALSARAFDQAETLLCDGRPAAGAKLAEAALVLGLFTSRPVRVGSLAVIDIAEHLRRDRQGRITEIVIPPEHVKNRKGERIEIAPDLAMRIDRHISALRPYIPGAQLGPALFPAPKGGPRQATSISRILRDMTKRQIGVAVRAHDLRHLAVDLLLEADPGAIPVAQQLLGHSSPRVTEEIYHGRRARSAQAQYAAVVASQLGGPDATADATRGKSRRARR